MSEHFFIYKWNHCRICCHSLQLFLQYLTISSVVTVESLGFSCSLLVVYELKILVCHDFSNFYDLYFSWSIKLYFFTHPLHKTGNLFNESSRKYSFVKYSRKHINRWFFPKIFLSCMNVLLKFIIQSFVSHMTKHLGFLYSVSGGNTQMWARHICIPVINVVIDISARNLIPATCCECLWYL